MLFLCTTTKKVFKNLIVIRSCIEITRIHGRKFYETIRLACNTLCKDVMKGTQRSKKGSEISHANIFMTVYMETKYAFSYVVFIS